MPSFLTTSSLQPRPKAATDPAIVEPIHQWYVNYLADCFKQKGIDADAQAIYDKCVELTEAQAEKHADDWAEEFNYADWNAVADGYEG